MAFMALGGLSNIVAVVQEDSIAEELLAKEKKVFADRMEEDVGTENLGEELIKRRRKPPPYMIKLFEDHTR